MKQGASRTYFSCPTRLLSFVSPVFANIDNVFTAVDVDAGCKLEVDESGSDDDLPPLEPNKNRRVIEYAVSETESDSE